MTQTHLHPVDARFTADSTSTITENSPSGPSGRSPSSGRRQKARAEKALPTDRLSFDKQVDVLRLVAQVSGQGKRPVAADEMSAGIGLRGNTGGLNSKFFKDCGWFEFVGRGLYSSSEALQDYWRVYSIDPGDEAAAKASLRNTIKQAWFWQDIAPMLSHVGVRQSSVLHALSKAAGTTEHTEQLQTVLNWLTWVGLVSREGELLTLAAINAGDDTALDGLNAPEPKSYEPQEQTMPDSPTAEDTSISVGLEPRQAPPSTDDALFSFTLNVRITAEDAVKLTDEQMKSLLDFADKMRR